VGPSIIKWGGGGAVNDRSVICILYYCIIETNFKTFALASTKGISKSFRTES
jgi:hypothetical protein